MAETERQPDLISEEAVKDLELKPEQAKDVKGGLKDPRPIVLQLEDPVLPPS
jgi:hypothetical protein